MLCEVTECHVFISCVTESFVLLLTDFLPLLIWDEGNCMALIGTMYCI